MKRGEGIENRRNFFSSGGGSIYNKNQLYLTYRSHYI